ncbi:viroplasmin family protein [Vibrio sp. D404a]|uniref:ribonuclease H family protein n=1 Tax=unclassified Vibrio TaxID=2614977 RepID=UPI00255596F2|nr:MULTISPECIES: ribonuclease H family protein [unclassified Vibrio]MDK9737107.1 viroplasmin family protein [Vibrio sp. D404a]MDK9798210.1 viroplasmin family protein [Vibrio sp. D449a]
MAKKYYVVWKGRKPGIFTTWNECKAQVDGFAGAKFKSFPTLGEAESAFGGSSSASAKPASGSNSAFSNSSTTRKAKTPPLTQQQIIDMPFDIKIFTDGACEPNPGEAGTGLAVYLKNELSELWYGLYQPMGTNNTAELQGLEQAFILAKEKLQAGLSVAIYSDSRYSIDCITKWASGWEKKGWTRSGGEIKNLDIIKAAYALYQELASQITIYHVNGHVGIEGNELADRMSIVAISSKEQGLSRYTETDDLTEILALRAG